MKLSVLAQAIRSSWSESALQKTIEEKQKQTENVLREIENNYVTTTKGHITFHELLMKEAKERGDTKAYAHHAIMKETYETILANYEASRRYSTI